MEQQLVLDRYRPLSELGAGGFGVVQLAWDTRMQRRVAIKRLPLPVDPRSAAPAGLAEARTGALLNHPAIVTVYDFETDEDEALLIMEYVEGASLATILADLQEALDLDEAAALIDGVAAALEFAHENGVLHLDIKPENILITRDGRVKVADFGIAALSTAVGHGLSAGGTIGYMPLEQLEGQRVSERTDEWALAAVAFELLTGENPFAARSAAEAALKFEVFEPPSASQIDDSLPEELDDVFAVALGPRPADRYPDVTAFADALLPLLGDVAAGRAGLADLASAFAEDEQPAERFTLEELGLWDRLRGRLGRGLLRALAAVECGWLAWVGLARLPLERPAVAGAVAVVALAGALAPSLGTALGLLAFSLGLIAAGARLIGTAFLLVATAWWWLAGRRHPAAATLPLAAPALGVAHIPFAAPLLAGFALPPRKAAVAGLAGGVLALLASAASGRGIPYLAVEPQLFATFWDASLFVNGLRALVTSPATYAALLGWPLAALLMSLFAGRASRIFAWLGALVGTGVLWGSSLLAEEVARLTGATAGWSGDGVIVPLAGSLILVALVTVLGAPTRPEPESAFEDARGHDEDEALA